MPMKMLKPWMEIQTTKRWMETMTIKMGRMRAKEMTMKQPKKEKMEWMLKWVARQGWIMKNKKKMLQLMVKLALLPLASLPKRRKVPPPKVSQKRSRKKIPTRLNFSNTRNQINPKSGSWVKK